MKTTAVIAGILLGSALGWACFAVADELVSWLPFATRAAAYDCRATYYADRSFGCDRIFASRFEP